MMRRQILQGALVVWGLGMGSGVALAQSDAHGGVAVTVSTLGYGVEGAAPVGGKANVRVSGNFFNFDHDFDNDGITIAASLKLRSVSAYLDLFPFGGGFHVSPGLMLHNGNRVDGAAIVPAGRTFDLGNDTLLSNSANPVRGDVTVGFEKVAPSLLLGWGNVVPRGNRRWSIPVEFGAVFSRAPTATLNLSGSACLPNGTNCRNLASDPILQADVKKEQENLNSDINFLKVIPVISFGFGYRF